MTRIVLWPGFVTSRNDGDQHYISADRLMDLYQLTPEQRRRTVRGDQPGFHREPSDIDLYPSFAGDYRNPESHP
jgi:hypothetical protein